jgi:acetolactate synthase-1/2/3 large subunit
MAPMGWSLGAAIGARLARPRRPVVALLGDGAMRMHGIELATASRYDLPILYVLFDNAAYGSVLARMGNDAEADTARLPAVDWRAFAAAFGVEAHGADDRAELQSALAGASTLRAPRLIIARVPAVEPDAYSDATGIDWGPRDPGP